MERWLNKIINADCLDVMREMPDKCIDLIVTDPPYGLAYNQCDLASHREAIFGGKLERMQPNGIRNDGEEEAMLLFEAFLKEARRVLKKGACCCCCCCGGGPKPLFARWTLLMDQYIGFKQAVVWDKPGLGMGIHYRRNYEFVLVAQNGDPCHRWNGGNKTANVWRIPKIIPSADEHPTAKPVELFRKIVLLHSNEDDVVLDPFAGHGTTAEACHALGRKYVCVEIDPKFHQAAEARIQRATAQMRLFHG